MRNPQLSAPTGTSTAGPVVTLAGNSSRPLTQLTPLARSDGPALFALTHANRDQLRVWLPWVDHILVPENTQAFVDDALEQDQAGKQKHFLLRLNDAIIGTISLVNIGQGQGTVGYWIAPAYQGRGYITQSVLELKTIAFEHMGLDCLHLEYLEGNAASARVAAKCGFTLDRVIERGALLHGRELDRMCCIARKPALSV